MDAVVMFSGGVGSWMAAKRAMQMHDDVTLLFTDTLIEDPDLYRFLDEAAADVGAPLVKVAEGRTPWQVFKDVRMLGNTRIAPCSRVLKQEPARAWVQANAPNATVVIGIDWTEIHRLPGAQRGWAPWQVEAPMCEPPLMTKPEMLKELDRVGIERPALYREGFAHNNCGGGCVRAGAAQFAHLYRTRPAVFAEWEQNEQALRDHLFADVAILRDRRDGGTKPLPLRAVREWLELQPMLFKDDEWGGCGCFLEDING